MLRLARDAMARLAKAVGEKTAEAYRFDAWKNETTGFGTDRDKTTLGVAQPFVPLQDETISALFHMNDLAERICSVIPQEMLREGFAVETGDPDTDSVVAEKIDVLDLREKVVDTMRLARAFGGAALVLGADDGKDASEPLDFDKARGLSYVHSVDRRYLWPIEYYEDPKHPKYGRPSLFSVTAIGGQSYSTSTIHESRLVIFRGAPAAARERMQLRGWDTSVLQRPHDILRQFDTGWKAVENLLTDANQGIYKISGLIESIGSPAGKALMSERMTQLDMMRSVVRALVIDADAQESFERQSTSFEGIPQTLDKLMLRLASAVQIPVTILMGQSPAGMSATGDSDFRWFYDRIRSEQTIMLAPRLRRIVGVWLKSKDSPTKGKIPPNLAIKFPPLWTLTPKEEAERRKLIAEADAIYAMNSILMPDEIALARFRPEGFDGELHLSKDAQDAREEALKADLDKLKDGTLDDEDDDTAPPGQNPGTSQQGPTPTQPPPPAPVAPVPADEEQPDAARTDASECRLFDLIRDDDETGVSGTGHVADGVLFPDGSVVLKWRTATSSTTLFRSVDDMLKVHGHSGKTRIRYCDEE